MNEIKGEKGAGGRGGGGGGGAYGPTVRSWRILVKWEN